MPNIEHSEVIAGVVIVRLDAYADHRGRLVETYRQEWLDAPAMVQAIRSESGRGVVRALHYHRLQADYWYVTAGRIFVGLYDLRRDSPTQGARLTLLLSGEDEAGLYIPPGIAHGFQAMEDATLTYLVDRPYDGSDELGLAWDDPDVGIAWPISDVELSERDRNNPRLAQIPTDRLPT